MTRFTETVRQLMARQGISVRRLAAQVNYDAGGLSKIINGQRPCPPHLARAIDSKLGAQGAVIDAASGSHAPQPDTEKIRRSLEDALADGAMSPALLDDWDVAVTRYGYRTRDIPSPLLLADLTADLADLRLAITRHRSPSALPRLALIAARMSGLICLTLIKAGDRQAFRRWARTARHAADEAGDFATVSWATAQEAYGYYYAGDMPTAVACARAALEAAPFPCVGGALAAALEMRACAVTSDAQSAKRALESATRIHAALSGPELEPSAFGYAESQLRFHSGDALIRLHDTAAALPVLGRALELCAPGDYTDRSLVQFDQAECMLIDGDCEAAAEHATQTLAALDAPRRQGIISARGRELYAALPTSARSSPTAAGFRDLLAEETGMKEIRG
jgi:hypothetical protein